MAEDTNPAPPVTRPAIHLPVEGRMPSFDGATQWLNSSPLTVDGLRGNVVLVQFWTYTCINWLRTAPYVRAWAEKYGKHGLKVIGVHTPEFPFEHDIENVRRAANDMRVEYPIAIDNNYAIWEAFTNRYWPALYFVDAQGSIRHHHFGEGAYDRSELVIQQLMAEAGIDGIGRDVVSVDARGVEAAADWRNLESPETYLGYGRTENFAPPVAPQWTRLVLMLSPAACELNEWALSGDWTIGDRAAVLNSAGGRIAYCFHARDLHLVLAPVERGTSVEFRVRIDGLPPRASHGTDVDDQGNGTLTEQRLYQLIRQHNPIVDRQFEIELLDSGVAAFVFTFG